jgi:predicted phage tail protein
MRKVILDGILGDKFGREWNLDVASPGEAIIAINSQRKNFKTWLIEADKEGRYFEVLFGDNEDEGVEDLIELVHPLPEGKTITFVPIVEGSDNKGRGMIKMAIGIAMIVISQGAAAPEVFSSSTVWGPGGTMVSGAGMTGTMVPTAFQAGGWANVAMGQLGWGMVFSGAAMYLTPEIADPEGANEDTNFLFNGAINTVKQGVPVPVVYGRMGTGSVTAAASLFTETATSFQSLKTKTKFTGIPGWRTPGSVAGASYNVGIGPVDPEPDTEDCPTCCIHEDMLIAIGEDMKSIHDIKIGDSVVSYNFETGENELVEVKDKIIVERDVNYKINDLILTEDHPIYLDTGRKASINPQATLRNYKQEVDEVKVGDIMQRVDETAEKITSIERYEGTHVNYTIKTKHNNFYANNILVSWVDSR